MSNPGSAALFACCLAAAALSVTAAERAASPGAPAAEARTADDGAELLAAVVRVRMKALAGARSSEGLGATREGSGVVIDDKGHIVTIGYLVIEADAIEVSTQSGRTFPATLVGYDHASGFGLLRATVPLDVRPLRIGDSAALAERDPVMIVPSGGGDAASVAYVISRRRFAGSWEYLLERAIFTAPPTLRWAGAALIDRSGALVGIGSLLVRDAGEAGSALPGNMFVPIDLLTPILAELIATGRRAGAARPWIGLATEVVQGRLFVTRVSPDGPAERAGIRAGDIVLGLGAGPVKTHEELYRRLWDLGAAGVEVPLRVLKDADVRDLRVRSIDRFEYFRQRPTY